MGQKFTLNIDSIVATKPAWDFVVTIGGTDYPTHFTDPEQVSSIGQSVSDFPTLLTRSLKLFDDPTPAETLWKDDSLGAFLKAYLAYLVNYQKATREMQGVALDSQFEATFGKNWR